MRALAWDEPLVWVTWKVVAVPAGASFHDTVKVTPFWVAVVLWAWAGCGVAEIAAGVGLVWVRRDGVGVVAVVFPVVAGALLPVVLVALAVAPAASALSVLAALASVEVAALPSAASAVAFVTVPSSALLASLAVVSACARCSAAS